MTTKMQHRRGTASQWSSANPVLAAGELGVVTDTARVKCGNGSSAWNDLPFLTLADGEVTAAKIADGAVTTGKIADGTIVDADVSANATIAQSKISGLTTDLAAKAVKAQIGNLLSETTYAATAADDTTFSGCTVTPEADASSPTGYALRASYTSGSVAFYLGKSPLPVVPGQPVTASALIKSATKTSVVWRIYWYDAAGTQVALSTSYTMPVSQGFVRQQVTDVAPAGAVGVRVRLINSGMVAGDSYGFATPCVAVGAGGDPQLPGVPIPNQSVLPVTQTPVPQAKLWAGQGWAPQPVIIGSGSPLGIVVPDFVGQEFVDTQQTLGARKWVATGTTAASWVVSDGRTPVWDISGLLSADWALADSAGHLRLSRTPHTVTFSGRLKRVTASGSMSYSDILAAALPSGFTPSAPHTAHGAVILLSSPERVGTIYDGILPGMFALRLPLGTPATYIGGEQISFDVTYATAAPWPTAAPV